MRISNPYRFATPILALALVAAACGAGDQANETGIPSQDPQLVETGQDLYQVNCAECHGSDLRGTDKGPSHLSQVYAPNHHGDGAFQLAVQIGSVQHHWRFGNMEPVEGLSEDDVNAVIAYVREQQRLNGFEPYPP